MLLRAASICGGVADASVAALADAGGEGAGAGATSRSCAAECFTSGHTAATMSDAMVTDATGSAQCQWKICTAQCPTNSTSQELLPSKKGQWAADSSGSKAGGSLQTKSDDVPLALHMTFETAIIVEGAQSSLYPKALH